MSADHPTPPPAERAAEERNVHTAVEITIRLGALLLLAALCLSILAPFAGIVLWAAIIAIAADEPYRRLLSWVGGRRRLAAVLFTVIGFTVLIVPSVMLSETLVGGSQRFAAKLQSGEILVPAPPEKVASLPVVGDRIYEFWHQASENLDDVLERLQPQLEALSRWLLRAAGAAGIALLQLGLSIVLAAVLLVRSEGRRAAITRFATRLAGGRGPEFSELANATVRSVVQGILGVAVIQATLAGVSFMLVGLPGAGLWALFVLMFAVVQVPVALALIPPVILVYTTSSTTVAVIFGIWCLLVSLIDNVLKPILFGRGVQVPTVVIFLGAIGGMLTMGIIGLFLGAVVLALGYELFIAWLRGADEEAAAAES